MTAPGTCILKEILQLAYYRYTSWVHVSLIWQQQAQSTPYKRKSKHSMKERGLEWWTPSDILVPFILHTVFTYHIYLRGRTFFCVIFKFEKWRVVLDSMSPYQATRAQSTARENSWYLTFVSDTQTLSPSASQVNTIQIVIKHQLRIQSW